MSTNIITQVRKAAEKHKDNVAVTKLIEKMDLAQAVVKSNANGDNIVNPLAGFEKASQGEDGYYLMINPYLHFLQPINMQIHNLHELAVIVDCLVSVLTALGEEFDY